MSSASFHHSRHYQSGHQQQSLDIGVNHGFPVIEVTLIFRFQSKRQSGIVYQHVNLTPFFRQSGNFLHRLFAVSHVESQCQHLCPFLRQFPFNLCQPLLVATCQNQFVTILSKFLCASQSDAACCACNQYDLIHIYFFYWQR